MYAIYALHYTTTETKLFCIEATSGTIVQQKSISGKAMTTGDILTFIVEILISDLTISKILVPKPLATNKFLTTVSEVRGLELIGYTRTEANLPVGLSNHITFARPWLTPEMLIALLQSTPRPNHKFLPTS